MNPEDEARLERLEENVKEAITPPVDEERIVALEDAVADAGTASDKPHTAMAYGVAAATVATSEKHQRAMVMQMAGMLKSLKWFVVAMVVAFFVVYLLVR